jgi:hypothetical protein
MPKSRDQQGRFISSSKNPHEKITMQVNHKRERSSINQITYPYNNFSCQEEVEASPQESETVQGSLHIEVQLSEEHINEQYHS